MGWFWFSLFVAIGLAVQQIPNNNVNDVENQNNHVSNPNDLKNLPPSTSLNERNEFEDIAITGDEIDDIILHGDINTFTPIIEDNKIVVALFHINHDRAIQELLQFSLTIDTNVVFMEVDCNEESYICNEEEISTYPQIIVYFDTFAKRFTELNDEIRQAINNMNYGMKPITNFHYEQLKESKETFVVYEGQVNDNYYFMSYIAPMFLSVPFYYVNSTNDKILIYNNVLPPRHVPFQKDQLQMIHTIASFSIPPGSLLTPTLLKRNDKQQNISIICIEELTDDVYATLQSIALKNTNYLILYTTINNELTNKLPIKDFPSIVVIRTNGKSLTPKVLPTDTITEKEVSDYLNDCTSNKIPEYVEMSQEIPYEKHDLTREINAAQFNAYKKDYRDVMIYLCDRTSVECQNLQTVFDEVSLRFIKQKHIDVVFLDISKNIIDTCVDEYPSAVIYSGFNKTRQCYFDKRPITVQGALTFLRESSKFGVEEKLLVELKEMSNKKHYITERTKMLKERKEMEESSTFKTKFNEIVKAINWTTNAWKEKNDVRVAADLQNSFYSYYDALQMWLEQYYIHNNE
ncbi:Thioredoxin domain-containing protein [Entamoeba marina]